MPNPTAAILIVGDEILSGRTRDANMHHLAGELTKAGIDLREARIVRDDPAAIVAAVNALRAAHDHVFTSGGIGPTHDDITADAVAAAFGLPLAIRADARDLLAAHYARQNLPFNAARQRMARIPEGASLIVNPVSAAPGFRIGNVHVMAGVPKIMQAMLEAIAPTLAGGRKVLSLTIKCRVGEGTIGTPFAALQAQFPDVKMGSYPRMGDGTPSTDLVLRSPDDARLREAAAAVFAMVAAAHRNAGLPDPDPY